MLIFDRQPSLLYSYYIQIVLRYVRNQCFNSYPVSSLRLPIFMSFKSPLGRSKEFVQLQGLCKSFVTEHFMVNGLYQSVGCPLTQDTQPLQLKHIYKAT